MTLMSVVIGCVCQERRSVVTLMSEVIGCVCQERRSVDVDE